MPATIAASIFGGNHTNGFYLSYDLGFGTIDNKQTVETGGRIAWIIDHSMAIGFFGNGFVSNVKAMGDKKKCSSVIYIISRN